MKVSNSYFNASDKKVQENKQENVSVITVLTSRDHPVNKKYFLNAEGQLKTTPYQNAARFDAAVYPAANICDLANLIDGISRDSHKILVRGIHPLRQEINVARNGTNFPEHSAGTPWVMLDIDDVELLEGMDPLSVEAIEWVIAKLPAEFEGVTYFYQFSSSSGILGPDGTLKKKGLNVHLFFWLSKRVPGDALAAHLRLHCLNTGFYWFRQNKGNVWDLKYGIDPAPIRSAVQAHYVALPDIGEGVRCLLEPEKRQDLIKKSKHCVEVPELAENVVANADSLQHRIRSAWLREHGFVSRTVITRTLTGVAASSYFTNPTSQARGGRTFLDGKLTGEDKYFVLRFDDENTPGSWFVAKNQPQIARRYGDGVSMALKELSEGAHRYVRDTLRWFNEVPSEELSLTDTGYLPAFRDFATARVSLVLAPTGTGKTRQAIDWIRPLGAGELVIYAAPTIALVNQMQADLEAAGLNPWSYKEVWRSNFPDYGVIVTTNESLRRILGIAYERDVRHHLILDEIHAGLDEFMRSNRRNELLEYAVMKAGRTLLLTGTLTTVQQLKLVDVASRALGSVEDFCVYEFQPVKRNPLFIRPLEAFGSDLVTLLEDFAERVKAQQALPRTVLIVPTSRMKTYVNLLASYGLLEYADVVSRIENTGEEIEAARTGSKPILISSPLFSLGLNFECEPEIFWCSFEHLKADTNQIIQTVNRANRGSVQCEVRVYVGTVYEEPVKLPKTLEVKKEVEEGFLQETILRGLLEEHLQIDRNVYSQLRLVEKNTAGALGELIENDSFQNYRITTGEEITVNKDRAKIYQAVKKAAKNEYLGAITERAGELNYDLPYLYFWKLEKLHEERRDNWMAENARVELEIQTDAQAVALKLCGLDEPAKAKQVDLSKVQRLFGERLPWVSAQYDPETVDGWAGAVAEKTWGITVVLKKIQELGPGTMDGFGLAASLTRNEKLSEGFLALANGELEYLALKRKFKTLEEARERARKFGSKNDRAKVQAVACSLVKDLLEPLGVFFGVRIVDERRETDYSKPLVPGNWDLPGMIQFLELKAQRLDQWPVEHKSYPVSEEKSVGELLVPKDVCSSCVYFDRNSCSLGKPVDWQGGEFDKNLATDCPSFKGIRVKKAA